MAKARAPSQANPDRKEHRKGSDILRLLFDTESDGFVANATKIHCIGIIDVDTGEAKDYGPDKIGEALDYLAQADELIGHNIQRHDLPLLRKLAKWMPKHSIKVSDTMVISRTMYSNIKATDGELIEKGKLDPKYRGKHSIAAWGHRLGNPKGDYAALREAEAREKGIESPKGIADYVWGTWTPAMQDYMMQDCNTNFDLWKHMHPDDYPQAPLELEHRVAVVCSSIEESGVPFDLRAAGELQAVLTQRKFELEKALKETFGFWYQPISPDPTKALFVPKKVNAEVGYWGDEWATEVPVTKDGQPVYDKKGVLKVKVKKHFKGYQSTKIKQVEFNPASRDHIARVLQLQGWKPEKFTNGGKPQIDEETVESIVARYPDMEGLGEYMMLEKRLSQLCGTDNSLMSSVKDDGRIHGVVNPGGTITGRCSHFLPNLGQVPSAKKPYGTDFRRLFYAPPGWSFLGADQQGLELRGLAHYLHPLDGGKYARAVLEGDPHWATVVAMGLSTAGERDKHNQLHTVVREDGAKRFAYAVIYGAGALKAGQIVLECCLNAKRTCGDEGAALCREFFKSDTPSEGQITNVGRKVRNNFAKGIDGFGDLQKRIEMQVEKRNYVPGLDGRRIPTRSAHAALNYLIQSSGAVLCKRWVADAFEECSSRFKLGWDGDFVFVLFVHDEIQLCVRQGLEEEIGHIIVKTAQAAGIPYGFRVCLDSGYSVGSNWADTH
jgi:DNA polymerase-1